MMDNKIYSFFDYLIVDEDSWPEKDSIKGLRPDTPEDVRKEYEQYLEREEELKRSGLKV